MSVHNHEFDCLQQRVEIGLLPLIPHDISSLARPHQWRLIREEEIKQDGDHVFAE